jgi:hypothetical protein
MNTVKTSWLSVKRRSELKNEPGEDKLPKKVKGFVNKQHLDNLPKVCLKINWTYELEEQIKPKNRPSYRVRLSQEQNTPPVYYTQEEI